MKLIEPGQREPLFTDFEDEIREGTNAPIDHGAVGTDLARFNRKVRQFLDAHRDHIAFLKLRRAEQLTKQDLAELERMFLAEGVGDETRIGGLRAHGGLGVFLRSLLGLGGQAAKEAFAKVLDLDQRTASQIQFIDLCLIASPSVEKSIRSSYESPFTDLNDQGLTGVFSQDQSQRTIEMVQRINAAAAA